MPVRCLSGVVPRIVAVFCVGPLLPALALGGGDGWSTDLVAAQKQASAEKKDLLLDFTGSDWCGWCIRLRKEVFDNDAFKKEAPKHFVLVELDFPRDKSKLSEATQKQNQELLEKFGVQGFPTILLTDSKGLPYAQTGYQAGGAQKYLDHLGELRKARVKRDEALAKAAGAEGVEKARHLDSALEAVGESLALSAYTERLKEIIALDGDNAVGLKAKYQDKLNLSEVRKIIGKAQESGGDNVDEIWKLLEKAEAEHGKEGKARVELGTFKAQVLRSQDRSDEALKLIDELLKVKALEPMSKVELSMQKAAILREEEKMDEVIKVLEGLAADETIQPEIRTQLKAQRAQTLGEMGKTDEALKAFDGLLAERQDWELKFRVLVGKGELLAKAGRKEAAAKAFDEAVQAAQGDDLKEQIKKYKEQTLEQSSGRGDQEESGAEDESEAEQQSDANGGAPERKKDTEEDDE